MKKSLHITIVKNIRGKSSFHIVYMIKWNMKFMRKNQWMLNRYEF